MAKHPFKVGDKVVYKPYRGRHHSDALSCAELLAGKTFTVRTAHRYGAHPGITLKELSPAIWVSGAGPNDYWQFVGANLSSYFKPAVIQSRADLEALYD